MREFKLWLNPDDFRPVAFYPYTSGTANRILSQNHNYKTECHDFLEDFGNKVKKMIKDLDVGICWDNKVVVELEYHPKHDMRTDIGFKSAHIFIGCYDRLWSIGMAMWQDPWLEKSNSNRYFTYPKIEAK